MKKTLFTIAAVVTASLMFNSCSEHSGYSKSDTGLFYKFHEQNDDGQKPELGDVLTVIMTYKAEDADTLIFDSKENETPAMLMLVKPVYNGDISEGLAMMAVNDSASFIISADSFFLKNVGLKELPSKIKAGTNLVFEIRLTAIKKKADFEKEQKLKREKVLAMIEERKAKEPEDIKKYVKDNNIVTKPTLTGLYYIETKRGTGAKVEKGKSVTVAYTGKLLDGTVFDSSEGKTPIEFVVGENKVIPGWEEGMLLMRVGGKAKMIIPSSLAYGANGAGDAILPYTPLMFEVEVVSMK